MLGNNGPIENVDLSEAFAQMLRELPWKTLRTVVQSNNQLHKRCTLGGHRLEPKQRKRIEKVLVSEAEKADFQPSFTNTIFAVWYPLQGEVHEKLEAYFHSEEYESYREEHDIEEDRYVLPDDRFEECFSVSDLSRWRLLVCFSPLEFSEDQAKTILEGSGGNQELVDQMERQENELEESRRALSVRDNELNQARKEGEKAQTTAQSLRQEKKELAAEVRQLRQQFETSQAENRKLRTEIGEKERQAHHSTQSAEEQRDREVTRLKKELAGHQEELDLWQNRYEEQRVQAKQLREQLDSARRDLRDRDATLEDLNQHMEEHNAFADLILDRIDWPDIARQMKLTPALRRQFNNLIRRLDYEEDSTLTIEGQLTDFWNRMVEKEQQLISNVAASNNAEVAEGDVDSFWLNLTDDFEDVKISLEARAILLKLLQDIFYQTLQMDDLEKPRIPTRKA